ncbi:MAG: sugar phosphate isomerase/epimerase [Hyphomonadaceae bacterium]|nr:sugar phosphate isomerase/epimerase [Hyphomonadaceae bacterium]
MTTTDLDRRVLWAANVRTKSFAERIAACRAGAFTHMSVFPIDWRNWIASGMVARDMRAMLADADVRILAIDPFVQWTPHFAMPDGYDEGYKAFIDVSDEDVFRIAEALEAEAINCVEGLGQPHPTAALIDAFGAFADRAASHGLRVTLEFMPISSIASLADAWTIVRAVNRFNAGLCFDTWHFYRSDPDFALLSTVPGDAIFEVQLADATHALQAETLTEDLLHHRRLPGDGEFDIARVAQALQALKAWRSVGPEVFADAMDARDAESAGRACSAALARFNPTVFIDS